MKARPILFSAPMVRALLAGRKTQTRRIVKPQPYFENGLFQWWPRQKKGVYGMTGTCGKPNDYMNLSSPYGKPGDLLWVRETWGAVSSDEYLRPLDECEIQYRADLSDDCTDQPGEWPADEARSNNEAPKWRPSIHMPRWASRITLEITDVRVERLQEISDGDSWAEGIIDHGSTQYHGKARSHYHELWESINGAGSWDANPWVWALTFKVHQQNVDKLLEAHDA